MYMYAFDYNECICMYIVNVYSIVHASSLHNQVINALV